MLLHLLDIVSVVVVLLLLGVEISVFAFMHPSARRLQLEPQLGVVQDFAVVLGRAMPVWYSASLLLLGSVTWMHRTTSGFRPLLAATAIWILTSAASFVVLVPLNNRVAKGDPDWQRIHRTWDTRHRVRVFALLIAAALLTSVVIR